MQKITTVAKLSDYGIARVREHVESTATMLTHVPDKMAPGTPQYRAPEESTEDRTRDTAEAADIWSLGKAPRIRPLP